MMRMFLLAAGMALACAAAQADTIAYTAQIAPTGYDAYGGEAFVVATPGFNGALGMLTGVSMTITGAVQDDIFGLSGDLVPFSAAFANIGSIAGYGFNQSSVLSTNAGTASSFLADNEFAVNAVFSTDTDLQDYASNAIIPTSYMFYSTVTDTETGQLVTYDSDYAQFTGTVTETFTYTTAVPEPASFACLAIGLLAVSGLAIRRRA
jgi:hypothetical protein